VVAAARRADGTAPGASGDERSPGVVPDVSGAGRAGALIALEGVDGCGKSTQARLLVETLRRRGVAVGPLDAPGTVVREPGGTPLGEGIRELLLHRDHAVGAWAEALLYAAARSQLAHDVLMPALAAGRVVVLDRYVDSSLAYQGHARGVGIDAVLQVNAAATGGLLPDLSLVLELPRRVAAGRRSAAPDRIEAEGEELQERVADGYAVLMRRFPQRMLAVPGEGEKAAVAAAVADVVLPWLERRGLLDRQASEEPS
jgi:dTMP kinase